MHTGRRKIIGGLIGLGLSSWVKALPTTPQQSSGPFYPVELPLDDDNDLTHINGRDGIAKGEITDLTGRILDRNGNPLGNHRIEIWQCDYNGRYRHPRENGDAPIDPNFQGLGHFISNNNGQYRFRTIRPRPYPGRTPHIHLAIFREGEKPFVTQLYVEGEAQNQEDFLYRRIPTERRPLVTARFVKSQIPGSDLLATFDLVMA